MAFDVNLLEIPEMHTVERDGKRYYVTPEGNHYPSVTTVLGEYGDKSGIERWKQRIGEEEAKRVLTRASRRGTGVHLMCEKFLLNQQFDIGKEIPNQVALFKQLAPILEDRIQVVRASECALYSDKLRVAGRCDAVVRFDNVETILDFKTSNQVKQEKYIENYFLQATLYSCMLYEQTGFKAPQIAIAIAVESQDHPQIFVKQAKYYIDEAILATKLYHAQIAVD